MQKWEYELVSERSVEVLIKQLDELGAQGWEAVGLYTEVETAGGSACTNSGDTVVLLKRPKE